MTTYLLIFAASFAAGAIAAFGLMPLLMWIFLRTVGRDMAEEAEIDAEKAEGYTE